MLNYNSTTILFLIQSIQWQKFMKIIGFAASSSSQSINKKLVTCAAKLLQEQDCEILDLRDYELPLFSSDAEAKLGQPGPAKRFLDKLGSSDAIIISFAEHNGSYTAAYKNLFDWCSRIDSKVFQGKPMLMLSTSPGGRGGASVLAQAVTSAPFFGGSVKASLSIPSFGENFDSELRQISNEELARSLDDAVKLLLS